MDLFLGKKPIKRDFLNKILSTISDIIKIKEQQYIITNKLPKKDNYISFIDNLFETST